MAWSGMEVKCLGLSAIRIRPHVIRVWAKVGNIRVKRKMRESASLVDRFIELDYADLCITEINLWLSYECDKYDK